MECAGYTFSVVVWCVFVLSCKLPQFVRYSFVGCSLSPVNIFYSCTSSVHWSFLFLFLVATGPFSLQVRSCGQSVSEIWRTGDLSIGHNSFIFGDVRWPSPAMCDRAIKYPMTHWRYRGNYTMIDNRYYRYWEHYNIIDGIAWKLQYDQSLVLVIWESYNMIETWYCTCRGKYNLIDACLVLSCRFTAQLP